MNRRMACAFLLFCLVIGLLPVSSLAAGEEKAFLRGVAGDGPYNSVNFGAKKGTITYAITDSQGYLQVVKCNVADGQTYDYNLKLDYTGDKPILYLKDAHLGRYDENRDILNTSYDYSDSSWSWLSPERYKYTYVTQGLEAPAGDYAVPDVVIESDSSITSATECLVFRGAASITSVGDAKLTLRSGTSGICIMGEGSTLAINANLDIAIAKDAFTAATQCISAIKGASVVIEGGNMTLVGGSYSAIDVLEGDLTINGGNIDAVTKGVGHRSTLYVSGSIIINGGNIKVSKPTEGGAGITSAKGDVIINGGEVYSEGWNRAIQTGDSSGKLIITGGTVEALSLNTGTEYNVFSDVPNLSGYGTYDAYVGMDRENIQFYTNPEQVLKMKYFKLTQGTGSTTIPTILPTELTAVATTVPTTVPTTMPTTVPTTVPTTAPTKTPTQPVDTTDGDSGVTQVIIWVCVAVVVIVVATAVVIVVKKKKP